MQIPAASILIILNYDRKMEYVGYYQWIISVGNSIGPLVGSILYSLVGYLFMFLIIGSLFLIFLPLIKLTMPAELNEENDSTANFVHDHNSDLDVKFQEVSCWDIFLDQWYY